MPTGIKDSLKTCFVLASQFYPSITTSKTINIGSLQWINSGFSNSSQLKTWSGCHWLANYRTNFSILSTITQIQWEEFDIQKTLLDLYLATLYQYLFVNHTDRLPDIIIALADEISPRIYHIQDTIPTWKHAGRLLGLDVPVFRTYYEACTNINNIPFTSSKSKAAENYRRDSLRYLKRAGKYYVNQDIYAHIALQCIKYICQETWHP